MHAKGVLYQHILSLVAAWVHVCHCVSVAR